MPIMPQSRNRLRFLAGQFLLLSFAVFTANAETAKQPEQPMLNNTQGSEAKPLKPETGSLEPKSAATEIPAISSPPKQNPKTLQYKVNPCNGHNPPSWC